MIERAKIGLLGLGLLAFLLSTISYIHSQAYFSNALSSSKISTHTEKNSTGNLYNSSCLKSGVDEAELFFSDSTRTQNIESCPNLSTVQFACTDKERAALVHCSDHAELELVIAQFSSSPAALYKLLDKLISGSPMLKKSITITVYSKDNNLDPAQYEAELRTLFLHEMLQITVNVFRVPNIGRETLTFIHHIIAQWGNLAEHTLFAQEDMHSVYSVRERLEQNLQPNTGFLSLSPYHEICADFACSDVRSSGATWPYVRDFWPIENDTKVVEPLLMVYKSQFIMSRRRIHRRPLSDYIDYHQRLSAPAPLGHHMDERDQVYYHDKGYAPTEYWSDPYFGHTFERSWALIANCNNMALYETCYSFWTAIWLKYTFQPRKGMICGCDDY